MDNDLSLREINGRQIYLKKGKETLINLLLKSGIQIDFMKTLDDLEDNPSSSIRAEIGEIWMDVKMNEDVLIVDISDPYWELEKVRKGIISEEEMFLKDCEKIRKCFPSSREIHISCIDNNLGPKAFKGDVRI